MTFEKPKKWEFWKNEKKFAGDIIILQMCTKNLNHMRYSSWDTEWYNFFLSFWAIFCPLHLCTTNDDHTIYGSWHIKCDRHNSLSFQAIFFPFTPLTIQKIKILKKWKKTPGDIIILHMSTINQNHMMYDSWDIERDRQNFYHFGPFFALLPLPATPLPTNPLKGTVKW